MKIQNTKVLSLMTLVMVLTAALVCRLVPRLNTSTRLLPVDTFPRQLVTWQAGPDLKTDPEVQAKLPTARILERDYKNGKGEIANLMLLTATDDEDFHKPTACLPGQGWTVQSRSTMQISGHPVNVLRVARDGSGFIVLYYWVKLNEKREPDHSLMAMTLAARKHLVHEEMSLFVRVAMPDRPDDRSDLLQFTTAVWSALQPMIGSDAEVVLRS